MYVTSMTSVTTLTFCNKLLLTTLTLMVITLTFQYKMMFKVCLVIFYTETTLEFSFLIFICNKSTNADKTFVAMLVNVVTMLVNVVTMFL